MRKYDTDAPTRIPRPQFERSAWLNLNGEWRFDFDFSRQIIVPFAFQTRLSGIGETDSHDVVWYERDFELPTACVRSTSAAFFWGG